MAVFNLNLFSNGKIAVREFLFIPLFFSLYLVYYLFHDAGFQLESFEGRSISIATAEGIDIHKRVSTFYRAILLFILAVPALTYLIQKSTRLLSTADLQLLNASSAAGFCLLFFHLLGADMNPSLHLILAFQFVVFIGIGLKSIWKFDDFEKIYTSLVVWIAALSFSLYFLQLQMLALSGITGTPSMPVFLGVFSASLLFFYFLVQRTKPFSAAWMQRTIQVSSPLAFIPLLSVLSTEVYMILNQHNIHTISIAPIYFTLLALLFIRMFLRNRNWKEDDSLEIINHSYTVGRTWLPILAGCIAALATYSAIVIPKIDGFEDANRVLPLQQFFDFGKFPFLDIFSSHALSDFGPGALFSILNGNNALGGFVYQFIIPVLVTLVIYYFLFRITGNGLIAFFTAIFYPYSDFILPSYYNLIPVTALALMNIYRKQRICNYFIFFLVLVLMIFWRIDLGSANLVAGISGLLILRFAVKEFNTDTTKLLKGLGLTILVMLLGIVTAFMLHEENIFRHLSEAIGYMSSFQSYGLKDLSGAKDMKFYSLYFVLPLAVLLSAAHAAWRLFRNEEEKKEITLLALSILFLTIFFFANFQRGLVRHTLAEHWDTALTSYGFFIIAISVFFSTRFRNSKAIGFFSFILISTLLISNYKFSTPDLLRNNMYSVAALNLQKPIFSQEFQGKINRTPEPKEVLENYAALDKFMKDHFSDTSTFLDFSNSPMLYYYLHRITPNYFCQIPHTAHNDMLQQQFLDGLNKYDIPVVVFSNVPGNYWDNLDGIPNTLRHYQISEYIYRNYNPYAILNQHSIWLKKSISLKDNSGSREIELTQLRNLEIRGGTLLDSIRIQAFADEPVRLKNLLASPVSLQDSLHYYLSLSILSGAQGTLSVISGFSGQQGSETRKTDIRVAHGYSEPFIILDKKPGEDFLQTLELHLPAGGTYDIKSIDLIQCNYLPDLQSKQALEHSLKFIPYVWGSFDKIDQSQKSKNIASLTAQSFKQQADREIRFTLPPIQHKENGNYIRIKARAIGENNCDLILNYGKENEKLGGFVFTVKNSKELKEYKLRISSQYNWQNKEATWISLYPSGAELEIEQIELETGD
ncbi:MAG: hypothetical protein KA444_06010 [Bacteroidia bacterium]|nr:hypothetical protein [Bacteroidia bacterium]